MKKSIDLPRFFHELKILFVLSFLCIGIISLVVQNFRVLGQVTSDPMIVDDSDRTGAFNQYQNFIKMQGGGLGNGYSAATRGQPAWYTFNNVPNGTYDVLVTWPDLGGPRKVPYTVYKADFSKVAGVMPVDQSGPPQGELYLNVPWQTLVAGVKVSGGTVYVTVDPVVSANSAQTLPTFADGVMLRPSGTIMRTSSASSQSSSAVSVTFPLIADDRNSDEFLNAGGNDFADMSELGIGYKQGYTVAISENPGTFQFKNIPPGTYDLRGTWPVPVTTHTGGSYRNTYDQTSQFIAYMKDTEDILTNFTVVQNAPSQGITYEGVEWQTLAHITVSKFGTLQVSFRPVNEAGVIVDALMLSPAGSVLIDPALPKALKPSAPEQTTVYGGGELKHPLVTNVETQPEPSVSSVRSSSSFPSIKAIQSAVAPTNALSVDIGPGLHDDNNLGGGVFTRAGLERNNGGLTGYTSGKGFVGCWEYPKWRTGTFDLYATWPSDASASTDVVYSVGPVLMGNTQENRAFFNVNQTAAPATGMFMSVPWQYLGRFTRDSHFDLQTLYVCIYSFDAANALADAVSIVTVRDSSSSVQQVVPVVPVSPSSQSSSVSSRSSSVSSSSIADSFVSSSSSVSSDVYGDRRVIPYPGSVDLLTGQNQGCSTFDGQYQCSTESSHVWWTDALKPGLYDVYADWMPQNPATSMANYRVMDASFSTLAVLYADQNTDPAADRVMQSNCVGYSWCRSDIHFQRVGQFTATTQSIHWIMLSTSNGGRANGHYLLVVRKGDVPTISSSSSFASSESSSSSIFSELSLSSSARSESSFSSSSSFSSESISSSSSSESSVMSSLSSVTTVTGYVCNGAWQTTPCSSAPSGQKWCLNAEGCFQGSQCLMTYDHCMQIIKDYAALMSSAAAARAAITTPSQCPNGRQMQSFKDGMTYCWPDDGIWIADDAGTGQFIPGAGNQYFRRDNPAAYKGTESFHWLTNDPPLPATWSFPQVPEGDYELYGTWVTDPQNDYCSPIKVVERPSGSWTPVSTLGTWRVGQDQLTTNLTWGGANWQRIGTFHSTGKYVISVTIEACAGRMTIADAMLIHATAVPITHGTVVSMTKQNFWSLLVGSLLALF